VCVVGFFFSWRLLSFCFFECLSKPNLIIHVQISYKRIYLKQIRKFGVVVIVSGETGSVILSVFDEIIVPIVYDFFPLFSIDAHW